MTKEEMLSGIPALTEGDLAAINDLFRHYIFYRKVRGDRITAGGTKLYTSCCGKEGFAPEVAAKKKDLEWMALAAGRAHDVDVTCPFCGRRARMKDLGKSGKRKKLREDHQVLVLHGDGDGLWAEAIDAWKDYGTEEGLRLPAVRWRCAAYRFQKGLAEELDFQVYESDGGYSREEGRLGRARKVSEPFKVGTLGSYTCLPYDVIGWEQLEEHPVLGYCGLGRFYNRYAHAARRRWDKGAREWIGDRMVSELVSYLTCWCVYPRQMEMLGKIGLFEPVEDLVYMRKKWAGAMVWEEEDPRRAFSMDKKGLRELAEQRPPMKALEVRNYANRHCGARWDIREATRFCEDWGPEAMEALRTAKKYKATAERLDRYLEKQRQLMMDPDIFMWKETVFHIYKDYLDMAYELGYCMEHGAVLWPADLAVAHDEAAARLRAMRDEREAEEERKVTKNLKERKEKYEFELDGLRIVFPTTGAAIRREGEALDHCVGGYAKRHVSGVLTILFLRLAAAPEAPYVTIEMNGNRIRQIHGYHNDVGKADPRKTHKEFLDAWLDWLKRGSPREKDGTPKIGKRTKKGSAE